MKTVELALVALAAFGGRAGQAADGWEHVAPDPLLAFPADHGAHPRVRTEWWYVTGIVADGDDERFGFQLTIFRSGLDPRPPAPGDAPSRARSVLAGHLVVTEIETGRVRLAERLRRTGPLARADEGDLALALEDWSLVREEGDRLVLRAADPATGIGLALELEPLAPLVRHGRGGHSRKGPEEGNASTYVSWPRLSVRGELTSAGRARSVRGEGWFDHEWGTSQLGEGVVGWDWFSLRLAGGEELMLYAMRRADGTPSPFSAGTWVDADGGAHALAREDFRIEPEGAWTSPRSGGVYPARWRVVVPLRSLALEVVPLVPDSELATPLSTGVTYWEGPVRVTGSHAGEGYVELTGYAGSLEGRL